MFYGRDNSNITKRNGASCLTRCFQGANSY